MARRRADVLRIGYFGSYARGDWGVGSDVDLVVVLTHSDVPFTRRVVEWDATDLPVPADLLLYTEAEWDKLAQQPVGQTLRHETRWVYDRER